MQKSTAGIQNIIETVSSLTNMGNAEKNFHGIDM